MIKSVKILMILMLISTNTFAAELSIHFQQMRSAKGEILYLLFDHQQGFPDNKKNSIRQGSISAVKAQEDGLNFKDLLDGTYALSVFHDENSNEKLDTNFLGIPREGFGFSQNPKVLFGAPSFKKSQFILKTKNNLEIEITYF